jgi:hypothetical protein
MELFLPNSGQLRKSNGYARYATNGLRMALPSEFEAKAVVVKVR